MKWAVYKVTIGRGGAPYQRRLGDVTATSQPLALLAAFAAWPHHVDWKQAQAGFRAVALPAAAQSRARQIRKGFSE